MVLPKEPVSMLVFVLCVIVTEVKVRRYYFEKANPSNFARFAIMFLCGGLTAILVNLVGLLLLFANVVSGDSTFTNFSTILTLTGISTRDLLRQVTNLIIPTE